MVHHAVSGKSTEAAGPMTASSRHTALPPKSSNTIREHAHPSPDTILTERLSLGTIRVPWALHSRSLVTSRNTFSRSLAEKSTSFRPSPMPIDLSRLIPLPVSMAPAQG